MFSGAMALGGAVTSMITLKEVKKLEMDEKFISSYMKAKNHWGEGYREERRRAGDAAVARGQGYSRVRE